RPVGARADGRADTPGLRHGARRARGAHPGGRGDQYGPLRRAAGRARARRRGPVDRVRAAVRSGGGGPVAVRPGAGAVVPRRPAPLRDTRARRARRDTSGAGAHGRRGDKPMIVCLRTVAVPAKVRNDYLAWIGDGRPVREGHGILAELVLEPASGDGDTVV